MIIEHNNEFPASTNAFVITITPTRKWYLVEAAANWWLLDLFTDGSCHQPTIEFDNKQSALRHIKRQEKLD